MIRFGLLGFGLFVALPWAAAAQPWQQPRNQVSFRVEATREVANDWVAATLGVEEEGSDAASLAAHVNQRMAAALALAKGDDRLLLSSGAYQTQPVYDKSQIVRWRARQDLVLETDALPALTEMAGKLQAQGLLLRGIQFSVAPETRKRVEDELINEVLLAFRDRAGLVSRSLGRRGWTIGSINLGESAPPVPFASRGLAMEASAPALESGRSTLRVEANATIELE